jgi:glutamate dehydrogenase/leucine dehydrogenase
LYSPDFIANAGGLIRLAGLYLGMTEPEIDHKIVEIEHTTLEVLKQAAGGSTGAAAIAFAKAKIAAGAAKRELVGAGCGTGCGCR